MSKYLVYIGGRDGSYGNMTYEQASLVRQELRRAGYDAHIKQEV